MPKLRVLAVGATLLLSASALAATPAAAAPNGPAALMDCDHEHSNKDDQWGTITGNGVNYRPGPHLNCEPFGQFNRGTKIYYHCYTRTVDDGTWTWGRRDGTNQQGWINDDYLDDGGSNVLC